VTGGDWAILTLANELLDTSLTPPTIRSASREMGEQLLTLAECWPWAASAFPLARRVSEAHGEPSLTRRVKEREQLGAWHHAVAFATLAATAGATPKEAVLVFLHQAAMGVTGAGVRAIPIGHTHGQQVLARLYSDIQSLAEELADRELETAGSFCPAYEVFCHAQTQLYTRLFRS
jgi:urease accessory protein